MDRPLQARNRLSLPESVEASEFKLQRKSGASRQLESQLKTSALSSSSKVEEHSEAEDATSLLGCAPCADQSSDAAAKEFNTFVTNLWLKNKESAKFVQELSAKASKAGIASTASTISTTSAASAAIVLLVLPALLVLLVLL